MVYLHKYPLTSGLSWGDFKLDPSLPEGNYRIRAYTQYMRNFMKDFFFDKTIMIAKGGENNVLVSTEYSFKKQDNADEGFANLHFENKAGIAYADTKLSYVVKSGDETITKGLGKTSLQGNATISWKTKQLPNDKTGNITVSLTLPNNEIAVKSIPINWASAAMDVQLLPEGGDLIEGLTQKIGIKAIDATGRGEGGDGTILDNLGNELAHFKINSLGIGSFSVNCLPAHTYSTRLRFINGMHIDVNLPKAKKEGYVLSINNRDSAVISVKILASDSLVNGDELKLVAQQGGNIYYVSKTATDKQVLSAIIPRNNLPIGIVQFTLFSSNNRPVAERLIFNKKNTDLITLDIDSAKVSRAKRSKTIVSFSASYLQKPIIGSFSVAVSRLSPVLENESNILTSLLLTSDLAGYVEKPNHYFLKDDAETFIDLDNLMLTQGWRRFDWKDIINSTEPLMVYSAEKTLQIAGTVTKGGKLVTGAEVTLMGTAGLLSVMKEVTNDKGRFVFDNLNFGDSAKFVVQARNKKEGNFLDVKLDTVPNLPVNRNKNRPDIAVNVNKTLSDYIKTSDSYFNEMERLGLWNGKITLKEVSVVAKKNPSRYSQNLNGPGNADYKISPDQLLTSGTLVSALTRFGPLVNRLSNTTPRTSSLAFMGGFLDGPAVLILNGVEIDYEELLDISMTDIALVELLKFPGKTSPYGQKAIKGGVILITTWPPGANPNNKNYASGIVVHKPIGVSVAKTFYSPKYEVNNGNAMKDLRTTVYWNPQLLTDGKGNVSFDFYNTSESGTYRVAIEGIDMEGHIGHKVFTYWVK